VSFNLSDTLERFCYGVTASVGQSLLITDASRSHSIRHITLCRTPLDEGSTWQHTTLTRDRHPYPQRDSNS